MVLYLASLLRFCPIGLVLAGLKPSPSLPVRYLNMLVLFILCSNPSRNVGFLVDGQGSHNVRRTCIQIDILLHELLFPTSGGHSSGPNPIHSGFNHLEPSRVPVPSSCCSIGLVTPVIQYLQILVTQDFLVA